LDFFFIPNVTKDHTGAISCNPWRLRSNRIGKG
jgi:hypothetical protein